MDDGSTDETGAIVDLAGRYDSRIRALRLPHRGLVHALNAGLKQCVAPYIARMDADDVMRRDRLAVQLRALEDDLSLAAVGCHVRIFPRHRVSARLCDYERWLNSLYSAHDVSRDAFVECPVAHPSLMMRREMAALGYSDEDWPEDYDLLLRALAAGMRIGVAPERLLAWRDRPGSMSRTDARYDVERFSACKAHYLARGFLAAADSYVLWGYGDTGRMLCAALAQHGKRPSHIVEVKASRIGQRIHGARVIPINELVRLRGQRIVVSVARAAPRQEIRAALAAMEFAELEDFVCAA